nr:hypothetical protein [Marivirga sp.]
MVTVNKYIKPGPSRFNSKNNVQAIINNIEIKIIFRVSIFIGFTRARIINIKKVAIFRMAKLIKPVRYDAKIPGTIAIGEKAKVYKTI